MKKKSLRGKFNTRSFFSRSPSNIAEKRTDFKSMARLVWSVTSAAYDAIQSFISKRKPGVQRTKCSDLVTQITA
ncbi:hypothetical protein VZT92_027870 [Zoarces viviparus]|uniref:Uncharacterized protein n=1 Tax=Zoarces viviparus TaxID=48416 RepID=A0AAW1DW41_ZOAVI